MKKAYLTEIIGMKQAKKTLLAIIKNFFIKNNRKIKNKYVGRRGGGIRQLLLQILKV